MKTGIMDGIMQDNETVDKRAWEARVWSVENEPS